MNRIFPILVPLVAAAAAAYGSYQLVSEVAPDIDEVKSTSDVPAQLRIVEGDAKDSLLRKQNLQRVLDAIRKEYGAEAQLSNFRLAPSNVNVNVRKRDGSGAEIVIYNTKGKVDSKTNFPATSSRTFGVTKIKAGVPERIMGAVKEKSGNGISKVDYMVAHENIIDGKVEWSVFLKDAEPNHYIANRDGSGVRVPGEVTTQAPGVPSSGQPQTRVFTGEDARKINECIQNAGADAARIQDCLK